MPDANTLRITTAGELEALDWEVRGLCFSPDGALLAAGSETSDTGGGIVRIWDIKRHVLLHTLAALPAAVTGLSFSSGGAFLAVAMGSGIVQVWTADGLLVDSLPSEIGDAETIGDMSVAFMPSNPFLATIDETGIIRIWDICPAHLMHTFGGAPTPSPESGIASSHQHLLVFSPTALIVATDCRSEHGIVQLWDVSAPEREAPTWKSAIETTSSGVSDLAYSPDGRYLAIASDAGDADEAVSLWDTRAFTRASRLRIPGEMAYKIAFSPDSQYLAQAGGDGDVWIWDVGRQRPIAQFAAHTDGWDPSAPYFPTTSLQWSPDGMLLATGGWHSWGTTQTFHAKHSRQKWHKFEWKPEYRVKLWSVQAVAP